MDAEILKDFKKEVRPNEDTLRTIEKVISPDLADIVKTYGLGTFGNGYFSMIDPAKYQGVVCEGYSNGQEAVPFMSTAFGDIFVWQRNKYIYLIRFRHCISLAVGRNIKVFLNNLSNDTFRKDYLKDNLYEDAVAAYGIPLYGECFGFFPLLSTGGKEDLANVKRVNMKEYIAINIQFSGMISGGGSIF